MALTTDWYPYYVCHHFQSQLHSGPKYCCLPNFIKNPRITFCVILLTDRQTNGSQFEYASLWSQFSREALKFPVGNSPWLETLCRDLHDLLVVSGRTLNKIGPLLHKVRPLYMFELLKEELQYMRALFLSRNEHLLFLVQMFCPAAPRSSASRTKNHNSELSNYRGTVKICCLMTNLHNC